MKSQTATEYMLSSMGMLVIVLIIAGAITGMAAIVATVENKVKVSVFRGLP